jgi:hypothetical protein
VVDKLSGQKKLWVRFFSAKIVSGNKNVILYQCDPIVRLRFTTPRVAQLGLKAKINSLKYALAYHNAVVVAVAVNLSVVGLAPDWANIRSLGDCLL